MSITKKYSCGCDDNTKVFNKAGASGCCNEVQAPPSPCCETHDTVYLTSICFRPTCSVVATTERFFIAFKNICNENLPVATFVKFAHQAAGLLNIHVQNGNTFEVSLMDPTREGAVINEDDCVIVTTTPQDSLSNVISSRCLSGQFVAPALNAEATIVIYNGTGIPIGSTLTFTWEGETGSYEVTSFTSASGSLYAYKVKNTGSGHVPGTIVNGGTTGACDVPIEIITEVDLCNLSATQTADSFTVCVGGSPRSLVSESLDSIPAGDGTGGWVQKKYTGFDCCIFTDGVTKFTGTNCVEAEDTVQIQDTAGTECFNDAWIAAQAANASLLANIEGVPVIIVDWDNGTKTLILRPTDANYLGAEEILEFEAGSQICLGACCNQCTNGPQTTNSRNIVSGPPTPSWTLEGSLAFNDTGEAAIGYLIGFDTSGANDILALDSTYNDDVEPNIGKPSHADPLIFRQKICNTSVKGCDQRCEIEFKCELAISGMPENLRAHFEVGHIVLSSATLEDGVTPNPFTADPLNAIDSNASWAGYIDGPSEAGNLDTTTITDTSIGVGDVDGVKVFPRVAGFFKDYFPLKKCNCANSITWLYIRLEPHGAAVVAGNALFRFDITRMLKRYDMNDMNLPENDFALEDFA